MSHRHLLTTIQCIFASHLIGVLLLLLPPRLASRYSRLHDQNLIRILTSALRNDMNESKGICSSESLCLVIV